MVLIWGKDCLYLMIKNGYLESLKCNYSFTFKFKKNNRSVFKIELVKNAPQTTKIYFYFTNFKPLRLSIIVSRQEIFLKYKLNFLQQLDR